MLLPPLLVCASKSRHLRLTPFARAPTSILALAATQGFWAELAHGAAAEGVRHLDDLLLRRVRMGLFLPRGGLEFMDRIRKVAGPGLGWGDERWKREIKNYETLWNTAYASPWSPVTQREEGGVS